MQEAGKKPILGGSIEREIRSGERLTPEEAVGSIERAYASHNLRIHPRSRLGLALDVARGGSIAARDDRTDTFTRTAIRDLQEFLCIVSEIDQIKTQITLKWLLRQLMSGSLLPEDDADPRARNLQSELLFAAQLSRAGYAAILAEPDILTRTPLNTWAIAVKRINSPQRVGALIREAAVQIRRTGHIGLIALDFSRFEEPSHQIFLGTGERHFMAKFSHRMEEFRALVRQELPAALVDAPVAGIWYYAGLHAVQVLENTHMVFPANDFAWFTSQTMLTQLDISAIGKAVGRRMMQTFQVTMDDEVVYDSFMRVRRRTGRAAPDIGGFETCVGAIQPVEALEPSPFSSSQSLRSLHAMRGRLGRKA